VDDFPEMGAGFVYLARHGETAWNAEGRLQGHTDVPLNARGRAQALALAAVLADRQLCRIVTSDLSRARETGELCAAALGLAPPTVDARLRERGFGTFEGRTKADLARTEPVLWRKWTSDPHASPPGGESYLALAERLAAGIGHVASSYAQPERPVLVVSHGAALRAFLAVALGLEVPPLGNGTLYRVAFREGRLEEPALVWAGEAADGSGLSTPAK
jgi:broad specificity phosphatase PhoE